MYIKNVVLLRRRQTRNILHCSQCSVPRFISMQIINKVKDYTNEKGVYKVNFFY